MALKPTCSLHLPNLHRHQLPHPPGIPLLSWHNHLERPVLGRQRHPIPLQDHVEFAIRERGVNFLPGEQCLGSVPRFNDQAVRCHGLGERLAGRRRDLGEHIRKQHALERDGNTMIDGLYSLLRETGNVGCRERDGSSADALKN